MSSHALICPHRGRRAQSLERLTEPKAPQDEGENSGVLATIGTPKMFRNKKLKKVGDSDSTSLSGSLCKLHIRTYARARTHAHTHTHTHTHTHIHTHMVTHGHSVFVHCDVSPSLQLTCLKVTSLVQKRVLRPRGPLTLSLHL